MFRRQEFLDYTVQPTKEGRVLLATEAEQRIQIIDGVHYLDGYELPPANEDIWEDRPLTGRITRWVENPHTGELTVETKIYQFQSTFTNRYIRETNIGSIAVGRGPLYITWDQLERSREADKEQRCDKQNKFDNGWAGKCAKFFGIHRQAA